MRTSFFPALSLFLFPGSCFNFGLLCKLVLEKEAKFEENIRNDSSDNLFRRLISHKLILVVSGEIIGVSRFRRDWCDRQKLLIKSAVLAVSASGVRQPGVVVRGVRQLRGVPTKRDLESKFTKALRAFVLNFGGSVYMLFVFFFGRKRN